MRPGSALLILSAFFGGGALSVGQTPTAANEIPIELPVYTVMELPDLPPPEQWFHAQIEGFEVLANGTEPAVRDQLRQFQRFRQALDLVWPGVSRPPVPPALLVLCGANRQFDQFLPAEERAAERVISSFSLRGRELSALAIDLQKKDLFGVGTVDVAADLTADGAVSAAEGTTNDASGGGTATSFQVDSYRQLYREYVKFVLAAAEPRAPVWFEEGLAQLLVAMEITETSITVGKIEDPNIEGAGMSDGDFNSALKDRALLGMGEMFGVERDSPVARHTIGSPWAKQCYAFVHWGLYGNNGRNQKAFITFLVRASREAPTEDMFRACFGKGYGEMLLELRTHAEWTRSKTAGLRAGRGERIPEPAPVELRPATEAEVGRIKGELMLAAGLPAEARRAMAIPYMRGERDPELLALIGTYEAQRGDAGKARKFLEAAVRGQTVRPRAYVELARFRLEEERAKLRAGEKFGAAQASGVLGLLYEARKLPPALQDTYALMSAVWENCRVAPSPAHVDAVEEGLRFFPQDAGLLYATAALRKRTGSIPAARALIERALSLPLDAATQERFRALAASLPAPS